jgi:hypothetical protein
LRRGFEIYAAFLLLLIAYFVLIWVAGGGSRYLDETNTGFFFKNPGAAIGHAAILQYTPVNTDILPTFVLLHLAFPLVLWLLIRSATVALRIVVSALSHGADVQLACAGVANRRVVLQSSGVAAPVCVWRLVCIADDRAVARRAGTGVALSRVQSRHHLELGDQAA